MPALGSFLPVGDETKLPVVVLRLLSVLALPIPFSFVGAVSGDLLRSAFPTLSTLPRSFPRRFLGIRSTPTHDAGLSDVGGALARTADAGGETRSDENPSSDPDPDPDSNIDPGRTPDNASDADAGADADADTDLETTSRASAGAYFGTNGDRPCGVFGRIPLSPAGFTTTGDEGRWILSPSACA